MANAPLAPSRIQALGEKMLQIYDDANPQPMADLAETILQSDPTNELALRFLLHSLVRTKGYASANKLLAQKTSGMSLLDGTKIYMTSCRLAESDRTGIRDELRAWCEKYPESRYLRCLNLLTQKLPGELTPDEKGLLKSAWRQPRAWNIKLYSGFVEQWDGHPEKAQKNFEEERGRGIVGQLALADNLKRLGHTDEADSLVKHRHLNPEKTNPTEAWEQMLACTVLLDLVEASKFAHAYQKLRPEKAQGYLIGWLAARLSGNDSQAHELRSSSLELMQGSERYLVAKQLLEAQKLPSVTDLTNIEDISIRFDTALLFVMLDWEDKPLPLPSLKTAQLAFWPGNWPYDILNKLRSVISQPAAVAKVDAEGNSEKAKE
jgi:hypothetical protein